MIEPISKTHIAAWNKGAQDAIDKKPNANPYPKMTLPHLNYNNGYMLKTLKTENK